MVLRAAGPELLGRQLRASTSLVGRYRASDLLLAPNLISLARVPLALVFPLVASAPFLAFGFLVVAGVSDVLDGWLARRKGQVTATGAVVDPLTDKLFVGSVMLTLILTDRLPVWAAALLATREIGEAPLVLWWALSHHRRRARTQAPMANVPGKLATALQFLAVTLALFASTFTLPALFMAGGAGGLAAVVYWLRELQSDGVGPG